MILPRSYLRAAIMGALMLAFASGAYSWVLNGYRWNSADTTLYLQLSKNPIDFYDASKSWNDPVAAAIDIWNTYVDGFQVIKGSATGAAGPGDGANQAFFSNTIYGESWPEKTLAVTLNYSTAGSGTFRETDIIFNNLAPWNSYRGPMRKDSRGDYIYDLRRVALHEIGHMLGLGHPDEHNQSVAALMNSLIDDLDFITDDDIAGAHAIYGFRITSSANPPAGRVGQPFSYQITTNQPSSGFGASGLPSGLEVNPGTGAVTGTPTAAGTFSVTVTASRADKTASTVVQIRIEPPSATPAPTATPTPQPSATPTPDPNSALVRSFPLTAVRLAVDPQRSRIYATLSGSGVAVLDTNKLELLQTIPIGSQPNGLAVSAEGSRLWVAKTGATTEAIGVVDLNTLEVLPSIALPRAPSQIGEGLANRLYATPANDLQGIMQVDASTGAFEGNLISAQRALNGRLVISPDRRTLYSASNGGHPLVVERFDISQSPATMLQTRESAAGYVYGGLTLSHNGNGLIYSPITGTSSVSGSILIMSGDNLYEQRGMIIGSDQYSTFGAAAFSGDDRVLYLVEAQDVSQRIIGIYDTTTFARIGMINPKSANDGNTQIHPGEMIVSPSGSHLFVSVVRGGPSPSSEIRVYKTGRLNGPEVAASKRLANLSTRLHARGGEQSLIGGFIISGNSEKKVIVRAIGPSLPVPDHLVDPALELRDSRGELVAANDDWITDREAVIATTLPPSRNAESAIVRSLLPGNYTAIVGSKDGSAGVGLVEAYDLEPAVAAGVVNISTRGEVGNDEAVMIGGVIVRGDKPTKVVIRAIGPSLSATGVNGALTDPMLEVVDSSGNVIASNDDWRSDQEQDLIATTIPPADPREAAVVATVAPGAYTAVVRGKDQTTGIGLVEIYNLEQD